MTGRPKVETILATPEGVWPRYEVVSAADSHQLFYGSTPCRIRFKAAKDDRNAKMLTNVWSSRRVAEKEVSKLNEIFNTDKFSLVPQNSFATQTAILKHLEGGE